MILRALYDSLMMEDLLRKFHRFSRRRERDNEREKKFRTELEISRTRKSKIFTILKIKTILVKQMKMYLSVENTVLELQHLILGKVIENFVQPLLEITILQHGKS